MSKVIPKQLAEAEDLLKEVNSWSEKEIEDLPKLYKEKTREYRKTIE